eukprot:3544050-Rhodomonas_salina.3
MLAQSESEAVGPTSKAPRNVPTLSPPKTSTINSNVPYDPMQPVPYEFLGLESVLSEVNPEPSCRPTAWYRNISGGLRTRGTATAVVPVVRSTTSLRVCGTKKKRVCGTKKKKRQSRQFPGSHETPK